MAQRVPVYDDGANAISLIDIGTLGGGGLDGSGTGVLTGVAWGVPRERVNGAGLDLSYLLQINDADSEPPEVAINALSGDAYERNPFRAPLSVIGGPFNSFWGTSGGASPLAYFAGVDKTSKIVLDDRSGQGPNIAFQFAVMGNAKWDFGAWHNPIYGQGNVDFLFYNSQLSYPAGIAFNIDGVDNSMTINGTVQATNYKTPTGVAGFTGVHNGMNYEGGIATGPV